jgi:hypothetical protein
LLLNLVTAVDNYQGKRSGKSFLILHCAGTLTRLALNATRLLLKASAQSHSSSTTCSAAIRRPLSSPSHCDSLSSGKGAVMARQTLAADQSSEKLWVFLCDCCGDGAGRSRTSLIACRYQPCCWGLQAALNFQHTSLASITCEKLCVQGL